GGIREIRPARDGIDGTDDGEMTDHAFLIHEKDALLLGGHGVVMEPTQEVAVHYVKPGAADLIAGVPVRKRVGEAHDGGPGRLERPQVAQAVHRIETLVGIADERKRKDRLAEVPASTLEQVGRDLDNFGVGGPQGVIPSAHPVRVDTAEGTREAAREPYDHVRTAAVRGQVHHRAAESRQREAWRYLTDGRPSGLGSLGCGHLVYPMEPLTFSCTLERKTHTKTQPCVITVFYRNHGTRISD